MKLIHDGYDGRKIYLHPSKRYIIKRQYYNAPEVEPELRTLKYINSLTRDKQKHFTKMLFFERKGEFIDIAIEYKGNITVGDFMVKETHRYNPQIAYSFIKQLNQIIRILYEGNIAHNDLHTYNFMMPPSTGEHIYNLVLIDYGDTIVPISQEQMFDELMEMVNKFVFNYNVLYRKHGDLEGKKTIDRILSIVYNKHRKFWNYYARVYGQTTNIYDIEGYYANKYEDYTFDKDAKRFLLKMLNTFIMTNMATFKAYYCGGNDCNFQIYLNPTTYLPYLRANSYDELRIKIEN